MWLINPRQLLFFSGLLVLKVVVAYVYLGSIVTIYGYYGFKSAPINFPLSLINWIFYLFNCAILTSLIMEERVSSWIISLLFCISYVPCLVYFEESGLPVTYFVQLHLYWGMLIIFLKLFPVILPTLSSSNLAKQINLRKRILGELIVLAFSIYVCVVKFSYNGFYIHLDIVEVYGLRSEAADKNLGLGANYFVSWASLVFTIRGVAAFIDRQLAVLVLMLFLQLIIFSIAAHKFYLFSLPVAILAAAFYKKSILSWIPFLVVAVLLISEFLNSVFGNFYLVFIMSFRNMFLPALITSNFYDFFGSNPPDLLTQSIMGRLGFASDYTLPIPYLIDSVYGDGLASSNTGLSADAISNFGLIGVFIYPILFAFVLKLLDSASRNSEIRNNLGIIIFFTIAFLNTAFFTALLTGGVLFSLFFLSTQVSNAR